MTEKEREEIKSLDLDDKITFQKSLEKEFPFVPRVFCRQSFNENSFREGLY
jgi:hypothetical protein